MKSRTPCLWVRLGVKGSYAELYEELAGEPVLELHHQPYIALDFHGTRTHYE